MFETFLYEVALVILLQVGVSLGQDRGSGLTPSSNARPLQC